MCGFIGEIGRTVTVDQCNAWAPKLKHRGPDAFAFFTDIKFSVGHSRLAILGGLDGSKQPMHSSDGRYTLAYNGEIYNYKELLNNLVSKGVVFTTNGDTEVVLQGISLYGKSFLDHCVGMFALALYDKTEKTVLFARDRSGQKPLFIKKTNTGLRFSSEQRPLISDNDNLDNISLNEFLWFGFVPGDRTLTQGVSEFSAGCVSMYDLNGTLLETDKIQEIKFPNKQTSKGQHEFIEMIAKSLNRHLLSERKTCLLLSGGMDSALLAAVCGRVLNKKIDCVSMGIRGEGAVDESVRAREISKICGHPFEAFGMNEVTLKDLKYLSENIDTPVIDSSFLPMLKLCYSVSKNYTVALTGDGADELLGGYNHHKRINYLSPLINLLRISKPILGKPSLRADFNKYDKWIYILKNAIKYRELLFNFYFTSEQRKVLLGPYYEDINEWYGAECNNKRGLYDTALNNDYQNYLRKDILVKSDRMGMLNSLELRAPFLDDEFISYTNTMNIRQKYSKKIVKSSLKKLLPEIKFTEKVGFSIPISHWLQKSEIEDYVFNLINSVGIFEPNYLKYVRKNNRDFNRHGEEIYGLFVLASFLRNTGIAKV